MLTQISTKLDRSFYNRPTLEVLNDIIGKVVVLNNEHGMLKARIVEAEAYIGENDPACHASVGLTKRNEVMFGPPGYSYVYFIYGMYHCLNFVTEPKGKASAILLRAAEPLSGIDMMNRNSPGKTIEALLNGPGKFCRSFGINDEHNALDLTENELYLEDDNYIVEKIVRTPRIGISKAKDKKWRFYIADSDFISKK